MNNIQRLRRALAWIESKGLEDYKGLKAEVEVDKVKITVWRNAITNEQFRDIKRLFGPLTIVNGYDSKHLSGEVKIDNELSVTVMVMRTYECSEVDPSTMTEDRWDDIKSKVREGLIKIQDCKPLEGSENE